MVCRSREIYLAAVHALLGPVPSPYMAVGTGSDDAILFEPKPAHRIVIHDFGLVEARISLHHLSPEDWKAHHNRW